MVDRGTGVGLGVGVGVVDRGAGVGVGTELGAGVGNGVGAVPGAGDGLVVEPPEDVPGVGTVGVGSGASWARPFCVGIMPAVKSKVTSDSESLKRLNDCFAINHSYQVITVNIRSLADAKWGLGAKPPRRGSTPSPQAKLSFCCTS